MAGMNPIQVTIHFKSGFSIGSGFGLAGIRDSIVMKDSNGLPYIPGTSLKGIIRQACEEICLLKTAHPARTAPNDSLSPVTRIFGSPLVRSTFDFDSAYLKLPKHLKDPVSRGATWTEAHNAIDALTGTARHDHLFSVEIASGDLGIPQYAFRFSITPLSFGISEDLLSLLICSIRFAERLGAKKSRGKGVIDMVIDEPYLGKTTEEWVRLTFRES